MPALSVSMGGLRCGLVASPIRKSQSAPAAAIEFLPVSLGLGEAVGDGIDGRRMMAEAAMAAVDLDVLARRGVLVETGLPRADAVAAAEDRGGRHGRRLDQRIEQFLIVDLAARHHLVGAPGVGRFRRTGKWAAEADHAAHLVGRELGELARIEATQAPADEADLAPIVALEQFVDAGHHVALEAAAQAVVAALFPAVRAVAVRIEEAAQGPRARIVGQKARQDEDRMAIAARRD